MAVIVVAAHFHGPEFPQRVFGELLRDVWGWALA